ncbi:MAG: PKD domain-containing protein, partial [Acidimicrobiales bacterium]
FAGWALDDIAVTGTPDLPPANRPPVANAGPDLAAADADGSGAEPVGLDGSASTDPDGTVVSYEWREGGSLIATGPTPTVDLAVGAHSIVLTVTDDDGATADDTVRVDVAANLPPTAAFSATGAGLVVDVDGSASTDPDGTIAGYVWSWGDGSPDSSGPTASHAYDGPGTYTVTLTVTDNGGATGATSRPVTVGQAARLSEDLDDGVADGFTLGGLWHPSAACATPPSPPNQLGYYRDATCTYATGARTTGSAQVGVDLSGLTSASLSFDHRRQVEVYAAGAFDVMRVQVSTNGGASWTTLQQWDSRSPAQAGWASQSYDLAPYVGTTVQLRWFFDSMDANANGFAGWALDNLKVTGT